MKTQQVTTKEYTVKAKIPCVIYKNIYVKASSKKEAKTIAKDWLNGDVNGVAPYDVSGDYGSGQMYQKGVIESVTCDEEVA